VTLGAVTPAAGTTAVAPTVSVTAAVTGADAATSKLTLTGPSGAIAGTSTYSASTAKVTFVPTSALSYSTTYTAAVLSGTTPIGSSWTFTTAGAPQSLFSATAVPATLSSIDLAGVQVGTRFTATVAGKVTAIRFYKGSTNTGTHTSYLWSATGTKLATVVYSGETASGWQQATLATPVTLVAGTEYRVGVVSPTGRYSVTTNGLATATTSGSLKTPATGGAKVYGSGALSTTSANNYWVDVVFVPNA
jgi:hypothetical protein